MWRPLGLNFRKPKIVRNYFLWVEFSAKNNLPSLVVVDY